MVNAIVRGGIYKNDLLIINIIKSVIKARSNKQKRLSIKALNKVFLELRIHKYNKKLGAMFQVLSLLFEIIRQHRRTFLF